MAEELAINDKLMVAFKNVFQAQQSTIKKVEDLETSITKLTDILQTLSVEVSNVSTVVSTLNTGTAANSARGSTGDKSKTISGKDIFVNNFHDVGFRLKLASDSDFQKNKIKFAIIPLDKFKEELDRQYQIVKTANTSYSEQEIWKKVGTNLYDQCLKGGPCVKHIKGIWDKYAATNNISTSSSTTSTMSDDLFGFNSSSTPSTTTESSNNNSFNFSSDIGSSSGIDFNFG